MLASRPNSSRPPSLVRELRIEVQQGTGSPPPPSHIYKGGFLLLAPPLPPSQLNGETSKELLVHLLLEWAADDPPRMTRRECDKLMGTHEKERIVTSETRTSEATGGAMARGTW